MDEAWMHSQTCGQFPWALHRLNTTHTSRHSCAHRSSCLFCLQHSSHGSSSDGTHRHCSLTFIPEGALSDVCYTQHTVQRKLLLSVHDWTSSFRFVTLNSTVHSAVIVHCLHGFIIYQECFRSVLPARLFFFLIYVRLPWVSKLRSKIVFTTGILRFRFSVVSVPDFRSAQSVLCCLTDMFFCSSFSNERIRCSSFVMYHVNKIFQTVDLTKPDF